MNKNIRNNIKLKVREFSKEYEINYRNMGFNIYKMSIVSLFSAILLKDMSMVKFYNNFKEFQDEFYEELTFIGRYFGILNLEINYDRFQDEFLLRVINSLVNIINGEQNIDDDLLSWMYQYFNKGNIENDLSNTQFFTEKYMVKYLVNKSMDLNEIDNKDLYSIKIIDPACGGGNFLVYVLEELFTRCIEINKDVPEIIISRLINNIYGYDIDSNLAFIASINIKIKAINLLRKYNRNISINDISEVGTNVFFSKEANSIGSLDREENEHIIINVETNEYMLMSKLITENKYHYVFTNPPFQGVKGMNANLKSYIKKNYPNAKCDLCNAFIERILEITRYDGMCGIVTQNSWMFLNSYADLRKFVLEKYSIADVVDLGSSSFYDLSGEKANISLVSIYKKSNEKQITLFHRLRKFTIQEKANMLKDMKIKESVTFPVQQISFLDNERYRFEYLSFGKIRKSFKELPLYGEFGRPMQGTSTGDSSKFIKFRWENNDKDWILVSKGGGYCKWNGLNIYKVLWGNDGEYIRQHMSSVLRNVKYFKDTALVFSDTGTSGLGVRLLKENQIFVASGPGIRDLKGNKYAHIALLNSRLFSYYIRILSPKLTISAGYIARIPIVEELLYSCEMAKIGRNCCELKDRYLQKRVINYEFKHCKYEEIEDVEKYIENSIIEDLWLEFVRLENEYKLENIVMKAYKFSNEEIKHIYEEVGECAYGIKTNKSLMNCEMLDNYISNVIDNNCDFNKMRNNKSHLGIEGILESLALEEGFSPVDTFNFISKNIGKLELTKRKYFQDYLHKLILFIIGFDVNGNTILMNINIDDLINKIININPRLNNSRCFDIKDWIINEFNSWHSNSFKNVPILEYNKSLNALIYLR